MNDCGGHYGGRLGCWAGYPAAGLIMMMDLVTRKKHRKTHQQLRTLIHDQTQERDK